MVGVEDDIGSDDSCSANLQGRSHVLKMYNWVNYVMPYIGGGTASLPSKSTIDYVEKASHDPYVIINSDPGIQRLFLDDYNGAGQDATAPSSNGELTHTLSFCLFSSHTLYLTGYTSGKPTVAQLKANANGVMRTLPSFYGLIAAALFTSTASVLFA